MATFGERTDARLKDFKKGVDADESRRKREDAAVQLRKQIREEALQKKRVTDDADSVPVESDAANMLNVQQQISLNNQKLYSEDPQEQYLATQTFRKMLSVEQHPPIQQVIDAGTIPKIVEFLKEVSRPELQFEAAWVLTNVASGSSDQTKYVVELGAFPLFLELLKSPNEDVREQSIWAIGNISGDSPFLRDTVLRSGGVTPILSVLDENTRATTVRQITWTLSNLCRGKPSPTFEWISPILPALTWLLTHSQDSEVLTDACWAISYLSDGTSDQIDAVINTGVLPRIIDLLGHSAHVVQTPSLRAVGNIVTGTEQQTQAALNGGLVSRLSALLQHEKKGIRKEACWVASNVTAGSTAQIQEMIDAGLIPMLIDAMQNAEFEVQKEATWAICNATSGGNITQMSFLVESGCVPPLLKMVNVSDTRISKISLSSLNNLLAMGQQYKDSQGHAENPVATIIEKEDGLTTLENCQENAEDEVYKEAVHILETYFNVEEDDQDIGMDAMQGFQANVPTGGFSFS